jgi:hypothetical protein
MSNHDDAFKKFLQNAGLPYDTEPLKSSVEKVGGGIMSTKEFGEEGSEAPPDAPTTLHIELNVTGLIRKDIENVCKTIAESVVELKKQGTISQYVEFEMRAQAEATIVEPRSKYGSFSNLKKGLSDD